jgi:hypothetical protein
MSIEEIHKSAKGTKRTLLIVYYYLNEGKKKMSLKCPYKSAKDTPQNFAHYSMKIPLIAGSLRELF